MLCPGEEIPRRTRALPLAESPLLGLEPSAMGHPAYGFHGRNSSGPQPDVGAMEGGSDSLWALQRVYDCARSRLPTAARSFRCAGGVTLRRSYSIASPLAKFGENEGQEPPYEHDALLITC